MGSVLLSMGPKCQFVHLTFSAGTNVQTAEELDAPMSCSESLKFACGMRVCSFQDVHSQVLSPAFGQCGLVPIVILGSSKARSY